MSQNDQTKVNFISSDSGQILGEYWIKPGLLTEKQINQLFSFSQTDDQVRQFTSDSKRFSDRSAYEKWLEKGRSIFALVDEAGNLMGIIWFGKEEFPPNAKLMETHKELDTTKYSITFAMRLYGQARGKGIAKPYMRQVVQLYLNSQDYQDAGGNGIWLETFAENIPAVRTYTDLFDQVTKPNENGRILMVYPKPSGVQKI